MELICGACHGRLLAALPGTTVACPHCGTHLQTPAAESAPRTQGAVVIESGDGSSTGPDPATDTVRMDFWVPSQPLHASEVAAEPFTFVPTAAATSADAAPAFSTAPELAIAAPKIFTPVDSANPAIVAPETAEDAGAALAAGDFALPASERVDDPLKMTAMGLTSLQSEESASAQPAQTYPAREPARTGVSPMMFVIVVSYASAMTLACLYLAFLLLSNPRTLDLPDLAPPHPKDKKKVTSLIYLSPDQELPPANVLKLGQSRQYGSLKVTPLRVTRGPLEFEYYQPEAEQNREPEGPVLKLHLRFENVSQEQEFIPLDSKLVYTKENDRKAYGLLKANNFVCNVADRKDPAKQVFLFDLTPNGNWLLKGENLDREFGPGQVLETFIPTTAEQIDSLWGDLVWRVHFRKGYNRNSFRGVTTLIEVLFKHSDIAVDTEPTHAEPAPDEPAKEEPVKEEPAVKDA